MSSAAVPGAGPLDLAELSARDQDLTRGYTSQLSALKRDLTVVARQIELERDRKQEVERLIEVERQEVVPSEHVEAIVRRDDELRSVRDEKEAMLEWLRRGVNEAQRIAVQAEQLKASVEAASATRGDAESELSRLKGMESRLGTEIEDTTAKIKRLRDARNSLEEHTEHQRSLLGVTADITRSAKVDSSRLSHDAEELHQRHRDIETIEYSVSCLAAAVRRCQHGVEVLNKAVANGEAAADLPDADAYDSGDDADETSNTPVVMSSTKAKIGRVDALMQTLRSSLRRYETDQVHRVALAKSTFEKDRQEAAVANEELRRQCQHEAEEWRNLIAIREPQLFNAQRLRDEAIAKGMESGIDEGEVAFSLVRYYERENERLGNDVARLEKSNRGVVDRYQEFEADYNAIRELRKEYRELEAKKMVYAQTLRAEEAENAEAKFALRELSMATSPAPKPKKKAWRSTTQW